MQRTRRRVLLAGVAVAAAGASARAAALARRKQPVTLEMWGAPQAEQRGEQAGAWNARHPEAQLRFRGEDTAAGVGARRQLSAALAAGSPPHLVDLDRFQVATCVNWQMLQPLDEFVRRDKVDLAAFTPATVGEARGADGQLYGLPSSVDVRLLYWNKASFEEAGLDPEAPPPSWEALAGTALRLTRPASPVQAGRLGLHPREGQTSLHLFAWQNGGGFLSADGRTATLPLAPNQEALQWQADLARALERRSPGALDDPAAAAAVRSGQQHPFLTGARAMQYDVDGFTGHVIARYRPQLRFGVAMPPARSPGDPPLTWAGGYGYVLPRSAGHAALAWECARWLVSGEGVLAAHEPCAARAHAAGAHYLPSMSGQVALDRTILLRYAGTPGLAQVAALTLEAVGGARVREHSIAAADLWDGVARAQAEALVHGRPAAAALQENNALVQRALDQAWSVAPRRSG